MMLLWEVLGARVAWWGSPASSPLSPLLVASVPVVRSVCVLLRMDFGVVELWPGMCEGGAFLWGWVRVVPPVLPLRDVPPTWN